MISKAESKSKVLDFLNLIYADFEIMIVDDKTIEEEGFLVFFYNSKEYLINNNTSYALAGNGGIIVDKVDGNMYMSGTSEPIEYYINIFVNDKKNLERIDF
ncbi:MAG: YrhB domain-containing protein [Cellulophaga sp.]